MARLFEAQLSNIECPHCKEMNELSVKVPGSFNDAPTEFQCFNAETQKGCLKVISIAPQITFAVLKPDWKELLAKGPTPE